MGINEGFWDREINLDCQGGLNVIKRVFIRRGARIAVREGVLKTESEVGVMQLLKGITPWNVGSL